jgi:hypothetical protein
MDSIFSPYLSPALSSHLSHLAPSTTLDSLSRTPSSRLATTALPHISLIELVSASDFSQHYDPLYVEMFPKRAERESSDLIIERLQAEENGERDGLAPYRIVGIRNRQGEVVGAAQFSVLPVPPRRHPLHPASTTMEDGGVTGKPGEGDSEEGDLVEVARFAIPYLQYIYVHPNHRRQDMSEVLHTMVLAVASADANIMDEQDASNSSSTSISTSGSATTREVLSTGRRDKQRRTVPFTLFETEPPDHGDDHHSRAYALERSKIHAKSGGVALVLRRRRKAQPLVSALSNSDPAETKLSNGSVESEEDEILSAHVQPGLEPADPPLTLVWMIRPSPLFPSEKFLNLQSLGRGLVAAYYQSLRDEGFPEKNIKLAERIVSRRIKGSTFETMPLADVKDFTMEGYLDTEDG